MGYEEEDSALDAIMLVQGVINGLLLGGIYALFAFGLSLCYGVTNITNSAHASFAIVGAMLAYWVTTLFGLDPILSIGIPAFILFFLGIATYRVLISRVIEFSGMTIFTLTFFLAYFIENLMILIWGNQYRAINTQYTGTSIFFAAFYVSTTRLIAFSMASIALVILALFIRYTYIGKALQAIGQNREGGRVVGINVDRLNMLTFAISLSIASLAGTFLALVYTFYPSLQSEWIGKLYAIITIGGIGSMTGSFIAAMIIGILETTVALVLPSMWASFFTWLLLMFTLLVRPRGLLGRK